MHILLSELKDNLEFNNIFEDSTHLLNKYNKNKVGEHSRAVANEAVRLAYIFRENSKHAKIAGLLHDISAVIPDDKKIEVAESLNIDILPEEIIFPSIIHQKLSKGIAKIIFGITNYKILNAIGCHTTLKKDPTKLEMILFIADKLKWDNNGIPPYIMSVEEGLEESLEKGVFAFIKYLYEDKSNLKVVHPWLIDSYNFFSQLLGMKL